MTKQKGSSKGTLPHLVRTAWCFWIEWTAWLDSDVRGEWPKEATGAFLVAVLARFLRVSPLALIIALTPPAFVVAQLWLLSQQSDILKQQTKLLEDQVETEKLANIYSAFDQTSRFRVILQADYPITLEELERRDLESTENGHSPQRFPKPNMAIVQQLAGLGSRHTALLPDDKPGVIVESLRPLLRDSNSTISAGALLTLYLLGQRDLRYASLVRASLAGRELTGSDLSDASLFYADLARSWMNGADLSGADLRDANLQSAHLVGAQLNFGDLRRANLSHADLTGAHLIDSDLRDSQLADAYLSNAVMAGSNVSGAKLADARLNGANLWRLKGWREVETFRGCELRAVRNAPEGFLEWAEERGALVY